MVRKIAEAADSEQASRNSRRRRRHPTLACKGPVSRWGANNGLHMGAAQGNRDTFTGIRTPFGHADTKNLHNNEITGDLSKIL